MQEHLLYDILEADKGKLYIDMKERQHMMCHHSTLEGATSTWCFMEGSRAPILERRFAALRQLTAEAVVGPRVTDMLMEEEDF